MGNENAKGSGGSTPGTPSKPAKENKPMTVDLLKLVNDISARKSDVVVKKEFEEVWRKYDSDGNGYLDQDEGNKFIKDFMKVLARGKGTSFEDLIRELSFDPDHPNKPRSEADIVNLFFGLVDVDDDGIISRKEFEEYIRTYLPNN